jgi:hypothetical protein
VSDRLVPLSHVAATFALLVAAQTAHSIEEYVWRLYDVLAPARFVSSLVSSDLRRGFLIANVAIVVAGAASWLWVRTGAAGARTVMWVWIAVETVNGVGHPGWSIVQRRYVPGTVTAPLLLVVAITLAVQLSTPASSRR